MTDGIATSEDLEALRKEVDAEVQWRLTIALASPQPAPERLTETFTRKMSIRPSAEFDTEDGAELSGNAGTMVDLINRCLHDGDGA